MEEVKRAVKQKVAVEHNLTPVKDFLSQKGYDVESMDFSREYSKEAGKYDAIIVTGLNKDFLGMHNTNTKAVVIDAGGLTPEQVYNELKLRFD
jgi:hypothetical protein